MTVSVGADPEFFRYDEENGPQSYPTILPCVGIIPGSKSKPYDLKDGYFTHEDNVLVELGVPPSSRGWDLGTIVQEGKTRIVNEFFDRDLSKLYVTSHITFDSHQLTSKQAREFGCEPDFNAYENGKMRTIPKSLLKGNSRYAGGHIHIGGNFNCPPFVAALFADLFLSLGPMAGGFRELSERSLKKRSQYYGLPGVFRPKEYGIEYRTPSNWWTVSEDKGNYIGNAAFALGKYLEETTATTLRETVKKIDWLSVRELISNAPDLGQKVARVQAQTILYSTRELGVTAQ